jgi:hypothetical protein
MANKLDRLNELLKDPSLRLPDFRQTVDRSGSNLVWLRKSLKANPNVELKQLLTLDISSLLRD